MPTIEKVIITITKVDDDNAMVRITTDPLVSPEEMDENDDNPAVELGAQVWSYIQSLFEENIQEFTEGNTLQ